MSKIYALALIAPLVIAAGPGARPVQVGAEAELDACTSLGHVQLQRAVVRVAPHQGARQRDVLRHGHLVWICEEVKAGKTWYGIVYDPLPGRSSGNGVPSACGVNMPIDRPKSYRGPCHSGWLPAQQIHMDAG